MFNYADFSQLYAQHPPALPAHLYPQQEHLLPRAAYPEPPRQQQLVHHPPRQPQQVVHPAACSQPMQQHQQQQIHHGRQPHPRGARRPDWDQSYAGKGPPNAAGSKGLKYQPEANIYVYGFPQYWTENDLVGRFAPYGNIVSMRIARDDTGKSKTYGFVAFSASYSAEIAISQLNGLQIEDGRTLTVRMKNSTEGQEICDWQQGKGLAIVKTSARHPFLIHMKAQGAKTRQQRPERGCSAYVHFLPYEWDEDEIKRHFSHCGRIASCSTLKDAEGNSKGAAFINFTTPRSVQKAVFAMNNFAAGPKRFLAVAPKRGEDEFVPPQPSGADRPQPGSLPNGPTGHWGEPGSTVFVYFVPQEWSELELFIHFNHFGKIGNVSNPYGKGHGLITFESPLSAACAIKAMNGFNAAPKHYLDVAIKKGDEEVIKRYLDNLKDVPDYLQAVRGNPSKVPAGANLYVTGVPPAWHEEELQATFGPFGKIMALRLVRHADGTAAGYGFVGYKDVECAEAAAASLNGSTHDGSQLIVKAKDPPKEGDSAAPRLRMH